MSNYNPIDIKKMEKINIKLYTLEESEVNTLRNCN